MSSVVFGRKPETGMFHRFAKSGVAVCIITCALAAPARAGGSVAVIDGENVSPNPVTIGQYCCNFLIENGYACTVFPKEGPTAPLDPFDVVIVMSFDWSDPAGMLADFMRAGKTVITVNSVPSTLGVHTNPTVQAWIGANAQTSGSDRLLTTVSDPILGNIPPGTEIGNCFPTICPELNDTSSHPDAKVLARYEWGSDAIGIMRNFWEGGVSVYLTDFWPNQIFLNAVAARTLVIPTLSAWGLLALALTMGIAGVVLIRRRQSPAASHTALMATLIGYLFAATAAVQAEVTTTQEGGVTYLRLGDADPFHTTDRTVVNLRSEVIPNSVGIAVLWEEIDSKAQREPYYAISLDGTNVDTVRSTSYDLAFGFARFDPAIESPAIPAALLADTDSELCIVQFVTQPLSAFRAAVESQGATIYDFLPNHAYIAKVPTQTRSGVAALPFVRAVAPFHPAYRLEPFLADNLDRAAQLFPLQRYNVLVFEAGRKNTVADRIAAIGGLVESADAGKRLLEATLTPAQLSQVIRWDEVLFVDRWEPMEPDMDNARIVSGANYIETVGNYRGQGVRGEVFDCAFNLTHVDFGSSPVCLPSTRDPLIEHGGAVSTGNHGAATSAIIFGDGTGNGSARGLLPCGQGIVADWDIVGTYGPNRYTHTGELVNPSLPYKAVFQSTSGGNGRTTAYTTISADMDDILFDFDLIHCQAQGNYGNQQSRAQAWAKNTISVGGVKHLNNADSSDDRWCVQALPCSWDICASIGPAADGRVKPDLVHFYECIFTGHCCSSPALCSCSTCDYPYYPAPGGFNGTSAATPIVCGYAGLVFQMWHESVFKVWNGSTSVPTGGGASVFEDRPHATTVKAMLINTAYRYPLETEPPLYRPDFTRDNMGWGIVDVAALYEQRNNMFIVNETDLLKPLWTKSYTYTVPTGSTALRVTMVYADPPGDPNVTVSLVNDLSLKVVSPSGTLYWGNHGLVNCPIPGACLADYFVGNWSVPAGTLNKDHVNNVENVFIKDPQPGTWIITVITDAINQDGHVETPQDDVDYALVVSSGDRPRGRCCQTVCTPSYHCTCSWTSQSECNTPGAVWTSDATCADDCTNVCVNICPL